MTPVAFLRYRLRLAQNTQGIITTWNAGAQRIKGFKEEEAVGQHLRISFPEPYQKEGKPEREIEQARQQGTYKAEDWRRCKDGSLFWAKVVLTAVHGIFRKQVVNWLYLTGSFSKTSAIPGWNSPLDCLRIFCKSGNSAEVRTVPVPTTGKVGWVRT